MRKISKYLILLAVVLLVSCGKQEAKYVFMFIGDGMGPVHVNAAERYLSSLKNQSGIIKLNLNKAEHTGAATTYSKNKYITDSAAAGTALSSGQKTSNGTLCMNAEHTKSFKTIAQSAKEKGMKVGILTSVDIAHATPASFYAHQASRGNYYEIGKELIHSDFDFFGGGELRRKLDPNGIDSVNLVDLAKENAYLFINNPTAFAFLEPGAGKVLFEHPEVANDHAMPYDMDLSEDGISLADLTEKAIMMLDNEAGFFMMVEGGKIDWASHRHDAAAVIKDIVAFDEAVKVALDFYEDHKENTLIVITADHECGGMTLGTAGGEYEMDLAKLQWQTKSFKFITEEYYTLKKELELIMGRDSMLLDSAWAFSFIYDKTSLGDESKGLGLDSADIADLTKAYKRSFEPRDRSNHAEYILYGSHDPFLIHTSHLLSRKAGIGWNTYSHTGVPVPVRAFGFESEQFDGYYDNTDIYKKLVSIMNLQQ